jgi:hypothetical protein
VAVDFLLNYQGTAGYWEIQQVRFVEAVEGDMIVDGSLLARHVGTNELVAQTANLKDLVVQTAKIDNYAVTVPVSSISAGMVTVADNPTQTTLVSATITTHGQPVHIILSCWVEKGASNSGKFRFFLERQGGGTFTIAQWYGDTLAAADTNSYAFCYVDNPGTGTFTYSLKATIFSGSGGYAYQRTMALIETRK